jgi:hypothetical protein
MFVLTTHISCSVFILNLALVTFTWYMVMFAYVHNACDMGVSCPMSMSGRHSKKFIILYCFFLACIISIHNYMYLPFA